MNFGVYVCKQITLPQLMSEEIFSVKKKKETIIAKLNAAEKRKR